MPNAAPALRRLRRRTGIKSGPWADRVQMHPKSYSGVEAGRRTASPEFFVRCAALLTDLLGEKVETDDLIQKDGHGHLRNASAGGTAAETPEAGEAAEAETETEARAAS